MSREYHPNVRIYIIAEGLSTYGCGYCKFKSSDFITMAWHYKDNHLEQDRQTVQGLINYRKLKEIAIARGLANKVKD